MNSKKRAEQFCRQMLDDMHAMRVWPTEFRGVVRSEEQDRQTIEEIMQKQSRYVAFSGNIKAGKSTLLNQLLFSGASRNILPTDPTPETAKITLISSIPEDEHEHFEVEFYSPSDWCDVKAEYQASQYREKFLANVQYSESVGALEQSWIGHDKVSCDDFSKMAEYVSCHDPAKSKDPDVVRGKYVPFVKKVHVYCHSKWLSEDTTIVDTPGLADPNKINRDETEKWIEHAAFVFYVHSVENSANLSRGQKDFIRDYVNGIDPEKFAIIANFFDARMENVAEEDIFTDEEIKTESAKICRILQKEVEWCLPKLIFPFSAKQYRNDSRLDPRGLRDMVPEILRRKVTVGEFFAKAMEVLFRSLSGRMKALKDRRAELETKVKTMKATLAENKADLEELNQDEMRWKHDVQRLENESREQIKAQILDVNVGVKKVKGKVEDSIEAKLEGFHRSGALAKGMQRIVNRVLEDHFAPFHRQTYEAMVDYRNAAVGDVFCKKLVGFYNAYLRKGEQLQACAVEQCKVDFAELETSVWDGGLDSEWAQLEDEVDTLFAFYKTNLETAKAGVMRIITKHVYGEKDSILKDHYIKPYEAMLEYVLTQTKGLRDKFGAMKRILEEEIERKEKQATAECDENAVKKQIEDIEKDLLRIKNYIDAKAKEREVIRLNLM